MSMKKTRSVLSVILIIIIALGGSLFSSAVLLKVTVCNQAFMQRYLYSDKVLEQCLESFDVRIEALSLKSGIPTRAFEAVRNFDEISSDSPIKRLYAGNDTTLYTNDTIDKIEQLCIEYLEGNSIEYDAKNVRNTAIEAAKIYADSFGMKNTQELSNFIGSINDGYQTCISIALMLIVASIAMLFLLYKSSADFFVVILSAFTAQGISEVLTGAVCLLFKLARADDVYPQIYADAINSSITSVFVILMVYGVLVACASIFINVWIYKNQKKKNRI